MRAREIEDDACIFGEEVKDEHGEKAERSRVENLRCVYRGAA